ncbi:hypothetical protein O0L34_g13484 [Tuta absoluta]|nr:hypothetical protein O0L34_g13484 [Tuta absoluta]
MGQVSHGCGLSPACRRMCCWSVFLWQKELQLLQLLEYAPHGAGVARVRLVAGMPPHVLLERLLVAEGAATAATAGIRTSWGRCRTGAACRRHAAACAAGASSCGRRSCNCCNCWNTHLMGQVSHGCGLSPACRRMCCWSVFLWQKELQLLQLLEYAPHGAGVARVRLVAGMPPHVLLERLLVAEGAATAATAATAGIRTSWGRCRTGAACRRHAAACAAGASSCGRRSCNCCNCWNTHLMGQVSHGCGLSPACRRMCCWSVFLWQKELQLLQLLEYAPHGAGVARVRLVAGMPPHVLLERLLVAEGAATAATAGIRTSWGRCRTGAACRRHAAACAAGASSCGRRSCNCCNCWNTHLMGQVSHGCGLSPACRRMCCWSVFLWQKELQLLQLLQLLEYAPHGAGVARVRLVAGMPPHVLLERLLVAEGAATAATAGIRTSWGRCRTGAACRRHAAACAAGASSCGRRSCNCCNCWNTHLMGQVSHGCGLSPACRRMCCWSVFLWQKELQLLQLLEYAPHGAGVARVRLVAGMPPHVLLERLLVAEGAATAATAATAGIRTSWGRCRTGAACRRHAAACAAGASSCGRRSCNCCNCWNTHLMGQVSHGCGLSPACRRMCCWSVFLWQKELQLLQLLEYAPHGAGVARVRLVAGMPPHVLLERLLVAEGAATAATAGIRTSWGRCRTGAACRRHAAACAAGASSCGRRSCNCCNCCNCWNTHLMGQVSHGCGLSPACRRMCCWSVFLWQKELQLLQLLQLLEYAPHGAGVARVRLVAGMPPHVLLERLLVAEGAATAATAGIRTSWGRCRTGAACRRHAAACAAGASSCGRRSCNCCNCCNCWNTHLMGQVSHGCGLSPACRRMCCWSVFLWQKELQLLQLLEYAPHGAGVARVRLVAGMPPHVLLERLLVAEGAATAATAATAGIRTSWGRCRTGAACRRHAAACAAGASSCGRRSCNCCNCCNCWNTHLMGQVSHGCGLSPACRRMCCWSVFLWQKELQLLQLLEYAPHGAGVARVRLVAGMPPHVLLERLLVAEGAATAATAGIRTSWGRCRTGAACRRHAAACAAGASSCGRRSCNCCNCWNTHLMGQVSHGCGLSPACRRMCCWSVFLWQKELQLLQLLEYAPHGAGVARVRLVAGMPPHVLLERLLVAEGAATAATAATAGIRTSWGRCRTGAACRRHAAACAAGASSCGRRSCNCCNCWNTHLMGQVSHGCGLSPACRRMCCWSVFLWQKELQLLQLLEYAPHGAGVARVRLVAGMPPHVLLERLLVAEGAATAATAGIRTSWGRCRTGAACRRHAAACAAGASSCGRRSCNCCNCCNCWNTHLMGQVSHGCGLSPACRRMCCWSVFLWQKELQLLQLLEYAPHGAGVARVRLVAGMPPHVLLERLLVAEGAATAATAGIRTSWGRCRTGAACRRHAAACAAGASSCGRRSCNCCNCWNTHLMGQVSHGCGLSPACRRMCCWSVFLWQKELQLLQLLQLLEYAPHGAGVARVRLVAGMPPHVLLERLLVAEGAATAATAATAGIRTSWGRCRTGAACRRHAAACAAGASSCGRRSCNCCNCCNCWNTHLMGQVSHGCGLSPACRRMCCWSVFLWQKELQLLQLLQLLEYAPHGAGVARVRLVAGMPPHVLLERLLVAEGAATAATAGIRTSWGRCRTGAACRRHAAACAAGASSCGRRSCNCCNCWNTHLMGQVSHGCGLSPACRRMCCWSVFLWQKELQLLQLLEYAPHGAGVARVRLVAGMPPHVLLERLLVAEGAATAATAATAGIRTSWGRCRTGAACRRHAAACAAGASSCGRRSCNCCNCCNCWNTHLMGQVSHGCGLSPACRRMCCWSVFLWQKELQLLQLLQLLEYAPHGAGVARVRLVAGMPPHVLLERLLVAEGAATAATAGIRTSWGRCRTGAACRRHAAACAAGASSCGRRSCKLQLLQLLEYAPHGAGVARVRLVAGMPPHVLLERLLVAEGAATAATAGIRTSWGRCRTGAACRRHAAACAAGASSCGRRSCNCCNCWNTHLMGQVSHGCGLSPACRRMCCWSVFLWQKELQLLQLLQLLEYAPHGAGVARVRLVAGMPPHVLLERLLVAEGAATAATAGIRTSWGRCRTGAACRRHAAACAAGASSCGRRSCNCCNCCNCWNTHLMGQVSHGCGLSPACRRMCCWSVFLWQKELQLLQLLEYAPHGAGVARVRLVAGMPPHVLLERLLVAEGAATAATAELLEYAPHGAGVARVRLVAGMPPHVLLERLLVAEGAATAATAGIRTSWGRCRTGAACRRHAAACAAGASSCGRRSCNCCNCCNCWNTHLMGQVSHGCGLSPACRRMCCWSVFLWQKELQLLQLLEYAPHGAGVARVRLVAGMPPHVLLERLLVAEGAATAATAGIRTSWGRCRTGAACRRHAAACAAGASSCGRRSCNCCNCWNTHLMGQVSHGCGLSPACRRMCCWSVFLWQKELQLLQLLEYAPHGAGVARVRLVAGMPPHVLLERLLVAEGAATAATAATAGIRTSWGRCRTGAACRRHAAACAAGASSCGRRSCNCCNCWNTHLMGQVSHGCGLSPACRRMCCWSVFLWQKELQLLQLLEYAPHGAGVARVRLVAGMPPHVLLERLLVAEGAATAATAGIRTSWGRCRTGAACRRHAAACAAGASSCGRRSCNCCNCWNTHLMGQVSHGCGLSPACRRMCCWSVFLWQKELQLLQLLQLLEYAPHGAGVARVRLVAGMPPHVLLERLLVAEGAATAATAQLLNTHLMGQVSHGCGLSPACRRMCCWSVFLWQKELQLLQLLEYAPHGAGVARVRLVAGMPPHVLLERLLVAEGAATAATAATAGIRTSWGRCRTGAACRRHAAACAAGASSCGRRSCNCCNCWNTHLMGQVSHGCGLSPACRRMCCWSVFLWQKELQLLQLLEYAPHGAGVARVRLVAGMPPHVLLERLLVAEGAATAATAELLNTHLMGQVSHGCGLSPACRRMCCWSVFLWQKELQLLQLLEYAPHGAGVARVRLVAGMPPHVLLERLLVAEGAATAATAATAGIRTSWGRCRTGAACRRHAAACAAGASSCGRRSCNCCNCCNAGIRTSWGRCRTGAACRRHAAACAAGASSCGRRSCNCCNCCNCGIRTSWGRCRTGAACRRHAAACAAGASSCGRRSCNCCNCCCWNTHLMGQVSHGCGLSPACRRMCCWSVFLWQKELQPAATAGIRTSWGRCRTGAACRRHAAACAAGASSCGRRSCNCCNCCNCWNTHLMGQVSHGCGLSPACRRMCCWSVFLWQKELQLLQLLEYAPHGAGVARVRLVAGMPPHVLLERLLVAEGAATAATAGIRTSWGRCRTGAACRRHAAACAAGASSCGRRSCNCCNCWNTHLMGQVSHGCGLSPACRRMCCWSVFLWQKELQLLQLLEYAPHGAGVARVRLVAGMPPHVLLERLLVAEGAATAATAATAGIRTSWGRCRTGAACRRHAAACAAGASSCGRRSCNCCNCWNTHLMGQVSHGCGLSPACRRMCCWSVFLWQKELQLLQLLEYAPHGAGVARVRLVRLVAGMPPHVLLERLLVAEGAATAATAGIRTSWGRCRTGAACRRHAAACAAGASSCGRRSCNCCNCCNCWNTHLMGQVSHGCGLSPACRRMCCWSVFLWQKELQLLQLLEYAPHGAGVARVRLVAGMPPHVLLERLLVAEGAATAATAGIRTSWGRCRTGAACRRHAAACAAGASSCGRRSCNCCNCWNTHLMGQVSHGCGLSPACRRMCCWSVFLWQKELQLLQLLEYAPHGAGVARVRLVAGMPPHVLLERLLVAEGAATAATAATAGIRTSWGRCRTGAACRRHAAACAAGASSCGRRSCNCCNCWNTHLMGQVSHGCGLSPACRRMCCWSVFLWQKELQLLQLLEYAPHGAGVARVRLVAGMPPHVLLERLLVAEGAATAATAATAGIRTSWGRCRTGAACRRHAAACAAGASSCGRRSCNCCNCWNTHLMGQVSHGCGLSPACRRMCCWSVFLWQKELQLLQLLEYAPHGAGVARVRLVAGMPPHVLLERLLVAEGAATAATAGIRTSWGRCRTGAACRRHAAACAAGASSCGRRSCNCCNCCNCWNTHLMGQVSHGCGLSPACRRMCCWSVFLWQKELQLLQLLQLLEYAPHGAGVARVRLVAGMPPHVLLERLLVAEGGGTLLASPRSLAFVRQFV